MLQKDDIAIAGCFKCSRSLEKRTVIPEVGAKADWIAVHALEDYLSAIFNLELRVVFPDRAEFAPSNRIRAATLAFSLLTNW